VRWGLKLLIKMMTTIGYTIAIKNKKVDINTERIEKMGGQICSTCAGQKKLMAAAKTLSR